MIRTTKLPATRAAWPDRSSHGNGTSAVGALLASITVATAIRTDPVMVRMCPWGRLPWSYGLVAQGAPLRGVGLTPDAAAHPIQMGQEFRRQFVAKNQIHLPWQQQVFDRGQQPQEILVADLLPFKA